jgi:hypothetical protein
MVYGVSMKGSSKTGLCEVPQCTGMQCRHGIFEEFPFEDLAPTAGVVDVHSAAQRYCAAARETNH